MSRRDGLSEKTRSRLVQVVSALLAVALLWLALRGTDVEEIWQSLRAANWLWLPVLAAVLTVSHVLRAWRWTLLIDGLTDREETRSARLGETFAALMIGYMVNYVAPRLGEITRTATLGKRTGQPFTALLGTVVLERLLDVAVLAIGLLTMPLLMGDHLAELRTTIVNPALERTSGMPIGLILIGVALAIGVLGLGFWAARRSARTADGMVARKIVPLLASFREGIATLRTAPKRGTLIGLTLAIWGLYGLLGYLPLVMLTAVGGDTLAATYELTLVDGWCIMLIGGLGLIVPTPGGIGSYHYVTILALTAIYGVAEQGASTYAILSHGFQLVLYVLLGAVCLLAIGRSGLAAPPPPQSDGSAGRGDG